MINKIDTGKTLLMCGFSRDGERVVGISDDERLCMWRARNGRKFAALKWRPRAESGSVSSAHDWSPDGQRLVYAYRVLGRFEHGILKIWDVEGRTQVSEIRAHENPQRNASVRACVYSPDGRRIVSGSADGTLKLWDAETGGQVATFAEHEHEVSSCAYSPDGRQIVSTSDGGLSRNGDIRIWNADTGTSLFILKDNQQYFRCLFSPDGRHILLCSRGRTLNLVNARTGRAVLTLPTLETSERKTEVSVDLRWWEGPCGFSPDGRWVLGACADETLRVWDADTGEELGRFFAKFPIQTAAIVPGRLRIIASDQNGGLYILRLAGFELSAPLVTAAFLFQFRRHSPYERFLSRVISRGKKRTFDRGGWNSSPTATCPWCGKRFVPCPIVVDAIDGIVRSVDLPFEDAPCTGLPSEAWDDPRLLSECPHCHQPLRFNPFIVDNRERY